MKKIVSALTVLTLVLSMFPAVSASQVADGQQYVAYLSGNFTEKYGKSAGNIYTADGDVSLTLSNSNDFIGNIYYQKDNSLTTSRSYSGSPMPQDTTSFTALPIENPETPSISNYLESFTANGETIAQSAHYGNLIIGNDLNVDTSKGDVIIAADSLTLTGDLTVRGQGKFYLFVNSPVNFAGNIYNYTNLNQVHIFVPSFTLSGSVYGNIYQENDSDITVTAGAFLRGNLVTPSQKITVSNKGKIYGVVYAPNADMAITSLSTCMYGRVVAKSVNLSYGAELKYKCEYSTLCIPNVYGKYYLNVLVSPEGAGTVTTNGEEFSFGEVAEVHVTANEGYEFVGFDTNSVLPDADGKITMTNSVYLVANFKAVELPPDDPIKLEYSYAYLYGYGDDTGRVGPEDAITREQASALIFRILKQNGVTDFTGPAAPNFTDINASRWSYLALEYMTSIGVFDSSNDRIFPEQEITRGETAKIISIALNIKPNSSLPDSLDQFTDIDETNPYYNYIKALYDSGNLQGVGTEMMPNSTLTRAMAVTIINRLIGRDDRYDISSITESPYTDISPSDWYYEDIVRASFGFTEEPDSSDNLYKIDPSKKVPREQIDY